MEQTYLLAGNIVAGSACVLSVLGAFFVIFSFLYNTRTNFKWKEVFCKICCGYKITERNARNEVVTKYKFNSYHFILINLSVADIIEASSHLWGLCSNLESEFSLNRTAAHLRNESVVASGFSISCSTQAVFAYLSALASFFWTDILAVFLAFNIVFAGCSNNFMTGQCREGVNANLLLQVEEGMVIPSKVQAPNCCESPFFLYILFPLIGWVVPMAMTVALAVRGLLGYTEDYDEGG